MEAKKTVLNRVGNMLNDGLIQHFGDQQKAERRGGKLVDGGRRARMKQWMYGNSLSKMRQTRAWKLGVARRRYNSKARR
jgi:hypothetical protein